MYTATEISSHETYRFTTLDALTRRLGGTSWEVESTTVHDPATRTVMILRPAYKNPGALDIVTTVSVASEAVPNGNRRTPAEKIAATVNEWIAQGVTGSGNNLWFGADGNGGNQLFADTVSAPAAMIVIQIPDAPVSADYVQDLLDHPAARRTAEDVDAADPDDRYH